MIRIGNEVRFILLDISAALGPNRERRMGFFLKHLEGRIAFVNRIVWRRSSGAVR